MNKARGVTPPQTKHHIKEKDEGSGGGKAAAHGQLQQKKRRVAILERAHGDMKPGLQLYGYKLTGYE